MTQQRPSVALVGVGKMGQTVHLPKLAASPKVNLKVIVDPYAPETQLIGLAELWGCSWAREMPSSGIDLVVVSTPVSSHLDIASAAVQLGSHVLVEKPLGESHERARNLLKDAQLRDRRVFCGHMRRFYSNYETARSCVIQGLIGRVRSIKTYEGNLYGWARAFSADKLNAAYAIDSGVLFDVGSHSIDAVRFVLGAEFETFETDRAITDDVAVQADVYAELTITSEYRPPIPWQISLSNTTSLANCTWIEGETGTIRLTPMEGDLAIFLSDGTCITIPGKTESGDVFELQLNEVVARCQDGQASVIDASNILGTVEVLEAIQSSLVVGNVPWLRNVYLDAS